MQLSSTEILYKLLSQRRTVKEALYNLIKNKNLVSVLHFDKENERLERTIFAIDAHIDDAKLLLKLKGSVSS